MKNRREYCDGRCRVGLAKLLAVTWPCTASGEDAAVWCTKGDNMLCMVHKTIYGVYFTGREESGGAHETIETI